jgi:hypothetical protein
MLVKQVIYNFVDNKTYVVDTVGVRGVVSIEEHQPLGEDDKWHYLITYEDGLMVRTFNPNTVTYKKENK